MTNITHTTAGAVWSIMSFHFCCDYDYSRDIFKKSMRVGRGGGAAVSTAVQFLVCPVVIISSRGASVEGPSHLIAVHTAAGGKHSHWFGSPRSAIHRPGRSSGKALLDRLTTNTDPNSTAPRWGVGVGGRRVM